MRSNLPLATTSTPISRLQASLLARIRLADWVAALALFVFALVLRVYCLDCHGLWYDEVTSVETAQRGFDAIFNQRFGWLANQTPWHYVLVWLTVQPVDPTTTTLLVRLPSVLAGAGTCALTYGLGRLFFGRAQGTAAAVLVGLSVTSLDYSQDLRPYSVSAFLVTAAVYCLVNARFTGGRRVWWLFTLATIAAIYSSYTTLPLAAPTLLLCIFVVSLANRVGPFTFNTLRAPLWSLFVIILASFPVVLDLTKISGSAPALEALTPVGVSTNMYSYWTWYTRFGFPQGLEQTIQLTLLSLVLLGLFLHARNPQTGHSTRFGVWVCLLFVIVPVLELVVIGTTTVGMPRYILFVAPFYFLLVGNGLLALSSGISLALGRLIRKPSPAVSTLVAWLVVTLTAFPFGVGAHNYFTPQEYGQLTERADFRDSFHLLGTLVKQGDTVVLADNPEHGLAVGQFYAKGAPSTTIFAALDPRSYERKAEGDIYWVVATWGMDRIEPWLTSDSWWSVIYSNHRVVVLKENLPQKGILPGAQHLAEKWLLLSPGSRLAWALRGSVYQARGEVEQAVAAYNTGYSPYNLSKEYLETADAFAVLGDPDKAWREAVTAKLEYAGSPEVHRWMAQALQAEGYAALSQTEARIAEMLGGSR
jgi:4-amino-4-deoxy-L-arabinose transferase-like glycosyltransferase